MGSTLQPISGYPYGLWNREEKNMLLIQQPTFASPSQATIHVVLGNGKTYFPQNRRTANRSNYRLGKSGTCCTSCKAGPQPKLHVGGKDTNAARWREGIGAPRVALTYSKVSWSSMKRNWSAIWNLVFHGLNLHHSATGQRKGDEWEPRGNERRCLPQPTTQRHGWDFTLRLNITLRLTPEGLAGDWGVELLRRLGNLTLGHPMCWERCVWIFCTCT